ncbi:MAG: HU family DNA-binding protein [Candidatus Blackburnbacteria bacterium]|nr:HU family DNA-binding protein [Candidatus Blackburnbacteria bacterium]MBI4028746.1 HU family DNA-binding protein [Candidatus Blackburnbacteria bacterium]
MTKNDLIEAVARKAHLTKKAAAESVETFISEIQRALVKGEKIVISGFGTFYVDQRAKKKMFLRGREEEVPPHRVPRFKPGKSLKRVIKK